MARAAAGLVLAFLLPSVALALTALAKDQQLSLKERPVMKVVQLLQDMKVELQKDLDDDKAVHETLACWCKENDQQKTAAISSGESQLKASMDKGSAKMVEIKTKRDATQAEVDKDWAALNEAKELRMKENKDFHAEEVRLSEAIQSADEAITVLSRSNPGLAQVHAAARRLRDAQVFTVAPLSGPSAETLRSFMEAAQSAPSFLAVPGFQSYRPQGGQILGVLKQIRQPWKKNLASIQEAEAKAVKDFEALKAAKEEEIAAGKKLVVQLDEEYADFGEKHVQAAKELEDTKKKLELDRAFMVTLKRKCTESDAEFDARVKSRLAEIGAVEDTIKILNDDKAFDVFDKTVNAAFLQTSGRTAAAEEKARRRRAASVLELAAGRWHAPGLALLATAARLDAFTKVREEIDKMVVELKKQQEDEIEHRDWCIKELNANNKSTELAYQTKDKLQTKIADLKKTIETLQGSIEATEAEMAEMQKQMTIASDNREGENVVFQQTLSDQRLTQIILGKALDRMKQVYSLAQGWVQKGEQPGGPHVALSGTHTDPGNGPVRFSKYEENAGGSKVVKMIEEVIADAKASEEEALTDEMSAQSEYEFFMKDTNEGLTLASEKLSDLKEAQAKAKGELSMAETEFKQTLGKLEDLNDTLGQLRKSCNYVLDNFDARQAARAAEVDALGEAKGILTGMS